MRWKRWWYPFCMKPSKMMSFWRFPFWQFLHFSYFLYFGGRPGRRHEALAFKITLNQVDLKSTCGIYQHIYKIFQNFGPCGHIRGTLLQNILFENYCSPSSLTRKFLICFRKTYFTLQFLNIFVSEITWSISYLWNFLTRKPPVWACLVFLYTLVWLWRLVLQGFS